MEQITSYIQATVPGDKPDNLPNQDYIQVFETDTIFIGSVSDGLGSSLRSNDGARMACECVIEILKNENSEVDLNTLSDKITKQWQHLVEQSKGLIKDYRTTNSFVSVFKKEKIILAGQLGDVMISLRIDGLFRHFETTQKEFSNETDCLGSGKNERYKIAKYEYGHSFDFLIATDGISDEIEPLKLESFQNYLKDKFQDVLVENRNIELKSEIENIMKDKNNDDKSLLYTWTNRK
ncbi:MAG: protein phosphatase 2C domain-containing protein [Bacteroidales bacterium]|jgi:serine/threonine protein phosphatase PrpC|nr:protein phosphatase 2C domain-containing protein [Bacteroidales bacterium]